MAILRSARRALYLLALRGFRALPVAGQRRLVRVGTPGFTVGAVCFLEHGGQVLFLRQPHRRGWSLPGGLVNRHETAAQAVIREVREELGLHIEVGQAFTVVTSAGERRVDVLFRIPVTDPPTVRPGGEATAAAWLTLSEIADCDAATREILDAATAVDHGRGYLGRLRPAPHLAEG